MSSVGRTTLYTQTSATLIYLQGASMSNVTFAIEDDLLRKAKMAAVQMDTSLNSIVRTLLAGFVNSVGEPTKQTGNYRKLLDFSLGRIPYRKLMTEMHIESDEQLFLMMCAADLPMPTLPADELAKMATTLEMLTDVRKSM
jgi:hypothetical protein